MGISKQLKQGRLYIDPALNQIRIEGNQSIAIPYLEIQDFDWGLVYEKYVGQVLEDEGFRVTYRGLELGLLDRGIDLIAQNDDAVLYVQCKYLAGRITKSRMEWILYRASQLLLNNHRKYSQSITFMLIVNNLETNFSKRIPKGFSSGNIPGNKVTYPILDYFLSHNHTQDKVKLGFREIPMPT